MKNIISFWFNKFKPDVLLFFVAIVLIATSLIVGISDNLPMIIILFIGVVVLFYLFLKPWRNAKYYAIMGVTLLVLFALLLYVGIDFLVSLKLKGHLAEEIAMTSGFICVAGITASIIGYIVSKTDKR